MGLKIIDYEDKVERFPGRGPTYNILRNGCLQIYANDTDRNAIVVYSMIGWKRLEKYKDSE